MKSSTKRPSVSAVATIPPPPDENLREGVVLRAVSGAYLVQNVLHAEHPLVTCKLRGNLKKTFEYTTSESFAKRVTRARRPHTNDAISVGDRVHYTLDPLSETSEVGVIEEILPRRSRLARAGFRGREQTLVCNLDQLVIVFACAEPRVDPYKLDRFLVAAEAEGLAPLIIANKRDLVTVEEFEEAFSSWQQIGYTVLATSAHEADGIETLRGHLRGSISAFIGPSGVGKSSLLNTIQPGLNLRTGEIGYVTYKGKHTTTAAELIPLKSGGWVADTPGLRQLELLSLPREELIACFPEFQSCLGHCRFDNCRHESEPGCAIKEAVEAGTIQSRRYESFLLIAAESETPRR